MRENRTYGSEGGEAISPTPINRFGARREIKLLRYFRATPDPASRALHNRADLDAVWVSLCTLCTPRGCAR